MRTICCCKSSGAKKRLTFSGSLKVIAGIWFKINWFFESYCGNYSKVFFERGTILRVLPCNFRNNFRRTILILNFRVSKFIATNGKGLAKKRNVRLGRHTLWQVLVSTVTLCGFPMCMTEKGWFIVVDQHLRFLKLILQKHFHVFVLTAPFLQTVPALQHLKQIL